MMIYTLLKDEYNDNDVIDKIKIVSTKIEKILDYLSLDTFSYNTIVDFGIMLTIDGKETELNYISPIDVNKNMFKYFKYYTIPTLKRYGVDEKEIEILGNKISDWCRKVEERLNDIENKKKQEKEELKAEKERALYEKLKKKFESQ